MYQHVFQFFGLRENPFHVSPDPRFYFSTRAYDAALAELIHGVNTPQGFIVLTGEAGTGKTMLLNHFLDWLCERQRSSSYAFHPRLKSVELFDFILGDFGVPCESRNKGQLLAALHQWLIHRHAMGDSPVVIIDEAQAISVRTLDQLRLLLGLETAGSKLLQIVLSGQPELEEKLSRPELRQLHRRVMFRCSLLPLSMEETSQYVRSRLASAGTTNMDVFAQESLDATHTYARGIPRTVNLLCEHALIAGYAEQVKIISPDMIRRVAMDFDLTSQPAAAEERKLSARFGRLVPLRLEERPTRVSSESAPANNAKAGTTVLEPAACGIPQLKSLPVRAVQPVLIHEETMSLATPTTMPVNQSKAAAVPIRYPVVPLIAKPAGSPVQLSTKKSPVGWQGPSRGERLLRYWKEVRNSLVRDWKQYLCTRGPARAAARKRR